MARPIKETPILRGKDARNFLRKAEESQRGQHRVSSKKYEQARKMFHEVMGKATLK
jgi:hypothetical protein